MRFGKIALAVTVSRELHACCCTASMNIWYLVHRLYCTGVISVGQVMSGQVRPAGMDQDSNKLTAALRAICVERLHYIS